MSYRFTCLGLLAAVMAFSGTANAQQWSGGYSTNSGASGSGYAPPHKSVDNIGQDGQFIFGVERITGVYLDRQKFTYDSQGQSIEHTYKSTNISLLGVDAASPSQLPRIGVDYVAFSGITLGISAMYVHRSLSLDGDSGQKPAEPPTVRPDGSTFFIGGRLGFAYAFDETFGIWPRAGASYSASTANVEVQDPVSGDVQKLELKTHFPDIDLELLGVISPVEHVALLVGPYVDLGLSGTYAVSEGGKDLDRRTASLTSFGLLVSAVGYY